MPELTFSRAAKSDLEAIDEYTLAIWGETQADRYLEQIQLCCQHLAERPGIGRLLTKKRPGLRRMRQGSHIIYYRQTPQGVLITRILHHDMLPDLHSLDED